MSIRFDERIKLNKNRLLNTDDTYKDLYEKDASMSWPGDFVGRYSLALSSLYTGLDDETDKEEVLKALKEVVNNRNGKVNEHHFFGKLFNKELINEQQMSGNSWYIRSLVSYYRITKDDNILNEIKDITENFLLKVAQHYSHYPMKDDRDNGEVSGHLEDTPINGFLLSSDIGCAFILLDGFVDAYSVTNDERLKEAIENIIKIFKTIDYINLKCQTHATLTCSRAILRFYKLTNNEEYLKFVMKVFDDYEKYGMTLDYQNINWFNKLDSWTEPCCVVDSFILAHDLYLITKDNKYLKLFGRITTNGIRLSQRDNGGAGCTTILYNKDSILKCFMYEAWFCCSMRLGEGMKYLSESRLIKMNNNSYLMMYPEKYNKDGIEIDVDYYFNKSMSIKSNKDMNLSIYIPDGLIVKTSNVPYTIDGNLIKFNVLKDKEINVKCVLKVNKEKDINYMGDMLLTQKEYHTDEIIMIDGKKYSYVSSSSDFERKELESREQYL